jgi:hypothetical protein
MSLFVNNRPVTRKELLDNYNTLHDGVRNYVSAEPRYVPPSTVGYSKVTANENVYSAGLLQAKIQNMEREQKLRMIRVALERQRKAKKINHGPSRGPVPPAPVVKQPAFGHS